MTLSQRGITGKSISKQHHLASGKGEIGQLWIQAHNYVTRHAKRYIPAASLQLLGRHSIFNFNDYITE